MAESMLDGHTHREAGLRAIPGVQHQTCVPNVSDAGHKGEQNTPGSQRQLQIGLVGNDTHQSHIAALGTQTLCVHALYMNMNTTTKGGLVKGSQRIASAP